MFNVIDAKQHVANTVVNDLLDSGFDVTITVSCRRCERKVDVVGEEFMKIEPLDFLCGGSPWCCP